VSEAGARLTSAATPALVVGPKPDQRGRIRRRRRWQTNLFDLGTSMTAQMPDRIRWKGQRYQLCTLPLETLFLAQGHRPPFEMIHTANYRGYWASWRLSHGKLVLSSLEPNLARDDGSPEFGGSEPVSEIMANLRNEHEKTVKLLRELAEKQDRDRIVPSEMIEISEDNGFVENEVATTIEVEALLNAKQQPVFAEWYSGLLRLQKGNFVRVQHSGFLSATEREIIIEIREGVPQQYWVIDNAESERRRQQ
jgi:hypothetical protein